MTKVVSLAKYRKWVFHVVTSLKILVSIVVLVFFSTGYVQAQDVMQEQDGEIQSLPTGDTVLTTEGDDIMENETPFSTRNTNTAVKLTNISLSLPSESGIRFEFEGKKWVYVILQSTSTENTGVRNHITLSTLEEAKDKTIFNFYRETDGRDVVHFKRLDRTLNLLFSYVVTIHWSEEENTKNTEREEELYKNASLIVTQLNDVANLVLVDFDESPVVEEEETKARVREIVQYSEKDEYIDESILFHTQSMGEDEISEVEEDKNIFEEMGKEQMLVYIDENWNILDTNTMMENIDEWMSYHADPFAQSQMLWRYAGYMVNSFDDIARINLGYILCQRIISEYPLSYEYYDAKKLLRDLEEEYNFAVE